MPKTEEDAPTPATTPPRATREKPDQEERVAELNRKLARLNREAELLNAAMRQKPKKPRD